MGPRNVKSGPWNVIRGLGNAIMGPRNVNSVTWMCLWELGMWILDLGMWKVDLECGYRTEESEHGTA